VTTCRGGADSHTPFHKHYMTSAEFFSAVTWQCRIGNGVNAAHLVYYKLPNVDLENINNNQYMLPWQDDDC